MKRFLLAFTTLSLALFLAYGPATARTVCEEGDLLARLTEAEIVRLDVLARVPNATGRLYEVEKNGARSILFGTIHLPGRGITLPDALLDRLDDADTLLLEINEADQKAFEMKIATTPSMIFNMEGPDLTDHLTEAEWAIISDTLLEIGVPPAMAIRMKPWFLNLTLMMPPCATRMIAGGAKGLDRQLELEGEAIGLRADSLESVEAALEVFREGGFDEHIQMIRMGLGALAESEATVGATLALYRTGRIMHVWAITQIMAERSLPPETVAAELSKVWDRLVRQRNQNWMPRLIDAFTQGNAIAAVGALHLPSEDGLVALLQGAGFTVTPLAE